MVLQAGLVPALDRNAADAITGSEHIGNCFADKHSPTAAATADLIKNALRNPALLRCAWKANPQALGAVPPIRAPRRHYG